ncbi:conserved hypothetical protein [Sporisorium reilianum SRZ2]|uniref:Uncharacterized protein n=1 Tax=Sporisorium reilianum (strain SRZ2) TaxID=999809 RepID=E6ZPT5_SPORE|nr:conserved hypothetical protein [Sporisorium reilianum SRZ2]
MEPALPLPLRLDLSFAPAAPIEHATVSDSISLFLSSYAARTGTSNAATTSTEEPSAGASTGGVVAAQLTRLMNGLSGKIDYDAFTSLISNLGRPSADADADADEAMHDATPVEVLESTPSRGVEEEEEAADDAEGALSFSKAQELHEAQTPTLESSLLTQNPLEADSPSKKSKKDKKEKKEKKDKRDKKDKKALKAE